MVVLLGTISQIFVQLRGRLLFYESKEDCRVTVQVMFGFDNDTLLRVLGPPKGTAVAYATIILTVLEWDSFTNVLLLLQTLCTNRTGNSNNKLLDKNMRMKLKHAVQRLEH